MRKHFIKTLIAAFFVCSALTSASAAQKTIAPSESPVALFKEIYGHYPESEKADDWHKADKAWLGAGDVSKLPGWETLPLSQDAAALNKRVVKKIGKSGEVCIDYDLLSDSQDPNIAKFKIVAPPSQSAGPAHYQIHLQGTWRKETVKVTYVLVQEDGKWRVDDIITYSMDDKGHAVTNRASDMLKACLKD